MPGIVNPMRGSTMLERTATTIGHRDHRHLFFVGGGGGGDDVENGRFRRVEMIRTKKREERDRESAANEF